MRKFLLYIAVLCVFAMGLTSCQLAMRMYTGMKKPRIYYTKSERLDYYKPFYDSKQYGTQIYSVIDTASVYDIYKLLYVPRIYLENNSSNTIYVLDCYDDVSEEIRDINNGILNDVTIADSTEYSRMQVVLKSNKVLNEYNSGLNKSCKWNAYLVNTLYMGNKLTKRTLSITDLKDLGNLTILDVSVNKDKK